MLTHETLRNTDVATHMGKISFDENGESNDLSANQQKSLGELKGFHFIDEKEEENRLAELKKEEEALAKAEAEKMEAIKKEQEEAKEDNQAEDKVEDPTDTPKPKQTRTRKKKTAPKSEDK